MLRRFPNRLQLAVLCLTALGTFQLHAQTGIFMCLGSTSRNLQLTEFQACGPRNASQILSFSFGASLPVSTSGGILSAGPPTVSVLTLQKNVDGTTVKWATNVFGGALTSNTLAIGVNTTGPAGTVNNVTIQLTDPKVVNVSHSGAGNELPIESVSISYQTITVIDNTTSPPATITWSGN